jgi:hypothetical protein
MRSAISWRGPSTMVSTSVAGLNGRPMAATNTWSFEPKKWCTSAGLTPASAAMPRMVAPP